jgi:hypothetical protein
MCIIEPTPTKKGVNFKTQQKDKQDDKDNTVEYFYQSVVIQYQS